MKSKLSTAQKSKTTTFSQVFHPKKKKDNFLGTPKLYIMTKNEDLEQCVVVIQDLMGRSLRSLNHNYLKCLWFFQTCHIPITRRHWGKISRIGILLILHGLLERSPTSDAFDRSHLQKVVLFAPLAGYCPTLIVRICHFHLLWKTIALKQSPKGRSAVGAPLRVSGPELSERCTPAGAPAYSEIRLLSS